MDILLSHFTSSSNSNGITPYYHQCKNQISSEYKVQYATIAVTLVNIISSIMVIIAFFLYRKETKTIKMRILVYQNIFGAFFSIALLVEAIVMCFNTDSGSSGTAHMPSMFCRIEASITNFSILCTQCWSLAFGIHLFYSLNKDVSYSRLRTIFRRIEVIFFVVSVFIIPVPFLIMIFELPVGPNNAWISLYGVSSRDWCDFSAEWEVDGKIYDARTVALYLELSMFYFPMLAMFFMNCLLYLLIQLRLWRLSKKLKQRRREKAANAKKIASLSLNMDSMVTTVVSSASPPTEVVPKHARLKGSSRMYKDGRNHGSKHHRSRKRTSSSANGGKMERAPLLTRASSSVGSVDAVDVGDKVEELTLHQVFERDMEQYTKFMQKQMRVATYYVLAYLLSTTIWLASRLLWEFLECTPETKWVFVILLILLQCTGPRIECLTLSVIFGISEDTVAPKSLEEILSNMLTLKYFHHFCCQQTVDTYRSIRKQGISFHASHIQVPEHENLLYFYFDVQIFCDLVDISNYQMTNKIVKCARDISKDYMSESGALSLPLDVCSQFEKNQIRTIVANLTQEKESDLYMMHQDDFLPTQKHASGGSGAAGDVLPGTGGDTSLPKFSSFDYGDESYGSMGSVMESPPLLDRLSDDESDSSSQFSDNELRDPVSQLKALMNLLKGPQRECFHRLRNQVSIFRKSSLYSECVYELRINQQALKSHRRSLYYDVLQRAFKYCCRCLFWRPSSRHRGSTIRLNKEELYKFVSKEKKRKKRRIVLVKQDFKVEGLL